MKKILISPGYGAGWSSWSLDLAGFLLDDPTLIELAESGASEDEVEAYVNRKFPDNYFYSGGWKDVKVVELVEGTHFIVVERDGSESLQLRDEVNWKIA